MKYAIIENNVVVNIIKCDDKFLEEQNLQGVLITDEPIQIGQECIDGKFIEVPLPPVEIPDVKPMYMRFVLKQMGILSVIENELNKPGNELAKIAFDYTVNFKRSNAMINQMAPLLGLSSEQIDQLFLNAYAIEQGEIV